MFGLSTAKMYGNSTCKISSLILSPQTSCAFLLQLPVLPQVEKRMQALGALVAQHDPELIAFQELTPYICKLLFTQEWVINQPLLF